MKMRSVFDKVALAAGEVMAAFAEAVRIMFEGFIKGK